MPYDIQIQEAVAEEIGLLRPFEQRRIFDEIEGQLSHQPNIPTRRRKCLVGLVPQFEHVPPATVHGPYLAF